MPNRGPFDIAAHHPFRWHTYPKGHGMRRLDAIDVAWWSDAGASISVVGAASEDRFLESGSVRRIIENAGNRLMESQVAIEISNLAAAGIGMDGISSGAPAFFNAAVPGERCAILLDGSNDSISIGSSPYSEGYFDLRAAADQSVVIPSHPSFNLAGDLTLLVKVAFADWTPGSTQTIFSRWLPVSNPEDPPATWLGGKVIMLRLNGAGRLVYNWSTDGTTETQVQSTASVPPATDELWVAVTHDVNNGSAGNTVRFFISQSLAEPTSMVPLGTAVVSAGTTSFYISEETPIRIGSRDANQDRAYARFKTAIMRGSISGVDIGLTNEVFRFDADAIYDEAATIVPVAVPGGIDAAITGTILKRPQGAGACFGPQESSTVILCGLIGPTQVSGARLFDSQPASLMGGQAIHATGTSGGALTGRVSRAGVGTQFFVSETAITNAPDVVCLRIDRDAGLMRLWTNSGGETTTPISSLLGSSQRFTDIYIGSSNEGTQHADFDFYSGAILRQAINDTELDLIKTMFLDASDLYSDGDYWTVTTPGVFDGVYFAPGDQILAVNPSAVTIPAYLIPSVSAAAAPDAPDLEITGNIRLTAKVRKTDLTTGIYHTIAAKMGVGPPTYSWRWWFLANNSLGFNWSVDGSDPGATQVLSAADIAANFEADTDFYIGLDIDFDNDVVQSLTSDDGGNWYPIGAPVSMPLAYPFNAATALEIGRQHSGNSHIWDGRIYWAQMESNPSMMGDFPLGVDTNANGISDGWFVGNNGTQSVGVDGARRYQRLVHTLAATEFYQLVAPVHTLPIVVGHRYRARAEIRRVTGPADMPVNLTFKFYSGTYPDYGDLVGQVDVGPGVNGLNTWLSIDHTMVAPPGSVWMSMDAYAYSGLSSFDVANFTLHDLDAANQVVWRFDADDYPGTDTSWVDPRGRPWSVTNAAAVIPTIPGADSPMRYDEVSWARIPAETVVPLAEMAAFVEPTVFGFVEMNGPPSSKVTSFFDDPVIFPYRRLDIHNHDGSLWREDCPLIGGSVTVDYSRDERRSGDCEIWLKDANVGPGGLWYDKVFRFYRGIILSQYHYDPSYKSATLVWQIGSFMADRISEGSESANFKITFRDLSKRMMLSKLTEATTFPEGTEIAVVIRALAANSGVFDMLVPVTGKQIGKDFTFETGMSRWEIAKKIANDFGHELFFDHRGWLVMRPFIDPLTAPIYLNLVAKRTGRGAENRKSNVGSYDRSASDERIFNHIVVIAEGTDRTTVYRAEARNTLSNSPTSIERIGERTMTYTSNFITTQAQAQETADALLAINALEQFTINVGTAVYPWVEVGTTINFEDDNPNDNFPSRYLLLNATIPLGLENMSLAGSRITIIGSPPS